ncbi:hypothetical protein [Tunicatimonas pelagia]|uniref:hypothetical protein n=1 Tax=Tunicatimonas pelagia TaxID=931531 RepID=UPI00266604CC|nr:hypothetical protein [Tunicatimonas pelagia]WKN41329.1 hypothetical protein P0M28_20035 [Tunicatimonas pelagia]
MIEFKIQLEESVVQVFGRKQVEDYLQDFVKQMLLKAAAQDVLEDLQDTDLQNDQEWQTARHLAWQQEKHKYFADK